MAALGVVMRAPNGVGVSDSGQSYDQQSTSTPALPKGAVISDATRGLTASGLSG
jgi:hypothetical protein